MSTIDSFAVFKIAYADRDGNQRVFYVFPDQVVMEFGSNRWDFKIRTLPTIDPSNIARFFQFELVQRTDGWWRIDMIGQVAQYTEFERCGLPEEVILAAARRFGILICSSTAEERQVIKARKVWQRLLKRFAESHGDFKVEQREGRFWLMPLEGVTQ